MTNLSPSLVAGLTGKSLVGLTPVFAQAAGGGTNQLQQGFSLALGILFMFGFFWGVVKIWNGADKMSKGDADGKMGIIAGIIIAAAAAIMAALFAIFGMADGALTPTF